MAWLGKLEELRFNTQHGIVDQSLHALGVGARGVEGAVQATFGVSDGGSLWAVRYSTEGRARSLFASADVEAVRRLHPDNPRFERLGADDRLIVSEPFSDLPGVWREIPEATAVTVHGGGVLEERPFRVPTLSAS